MSLVHLNRSPESIERIAEFAHEANRLYCQSLGDNSQLHWSDAPKWQRDSAIAGVTRAMDGDGPEELHEAWCEFKRADGWVVGEVKDAAAKTHPCLVPYAALPPEQKIKDRLFLSAVEALANALDQAGRIPATPTKEP